MKKKISSFTQKSGTLFIAMIGTLVIIVAIFVLFTRLNSRRITGNNRQYLLNETSRISRDVDAIVSDGYDNIKMISNLISRSLTSDNVDISEFQTIISQSVFDFMEFADKDGNDHNITGGVSDARDRKYYLDAMKGNTGLELIFNSRATHETLLMFYSPVYFNNEIIGSLIGVYQASNKMTKALDTEYFGEVASSYLCTSDGRVIASNMAVDTASEPKVTDIINANETAFNVISDAFLSKKSCSFSLSANDAGGQLEWLENNDMVLIHIFPDNADDNMSQAANILAFWLVLALFAVFIFILIVVFINDSIYSKKLRASIEKTRETDKELKKQLYILRSMADVYYSMHLLDLKANTTEEYTAKNQVKSIGEETSYTNTKVFAENVMNATMSDEYLQRGLEFSDVDTLAERMKNKKYISADLKGKNVGWIRMMFITIKSDENGYPESVICTTQVIDEDKQREAKLFMEANTDELTGCFNRRAYEDNLMEYPDIPPENDFVFVSFDLNGLKKANDTMGHEAGDELIIGASKCMNQCFGNYGRVYRTGGDEFAAIIFANQKMLGNILADFKETCDKYSGKFINGISVSLGCASKSEFPDSTVSELASIADKRMYESKDKYYKDNNLERRKI